MKMLHMVAFVLVIIGALNWGLAGFVGFAFEPRQLLDLDLVDLN